MRASVGLFVSALLGMSLAGTARAGLIGDTVSYDGGQPVTIGDGPEFDFNNLLTGDHLTIDFTNDLVTITNTFTSPNGLIPIFSTDYYTFSFDESSILSIDYISGTVPEFPPSLSISFPGICVWTISDPNLFQDGTGASIIAGDPHDIGIAVGSTDPSFSVTYRITTAAIPEPSEFAALALPAALLVGRNFKRRRKST